LGVIESLSNVSPGLVLELMGRASLRDDAPGAEVKLAGGKPLAMLVFLHCAPSQTASREQLLELLWSDASPDKGRHTLRQTFWYIRRKLDVDPFSVVGDNVRLALPIPSDRDAFLAALDADDPDTAVGLYTGDFFPDFAAPGGAAFEQWADLERSRLRALFLGAASRVVRDRLAKGRARDAIAVARRVHDLAPRQQAAWRLLLESYLAADDTIGATVELERLERWLADEELEPEPATAQLIKTARSGRSNGSASASAPTEPAGLRAELVGREAEFSALMAALDAAKRSQSRHLHVAAAAGHGKTRLLEGFAARLRSTRIRVVAVRATPAERSLPYAFAAQLVSALVSMRGASAVSPDTARTLVALAPASSSYLSAEPDKATGDEALRRRSLALSELVATIAHDAPLVLLVDDVHWMDAQSRTVLASFATRLANASVLLVTAARTNDRWADETPSSQRVTLEPLSPDDVGALVMSIGRLPAEPWADAFVRSLHRSSKGSPLLVLETLQLVMEREQLQLSDGLWSTTDADALIATLGSGRAMQQRLSALPAAAREALLRLAVAGIGLDDPTLPNVLPSDSREALSLLETRGLVAHTEDRWRVAHDEIAAIAVEMAPDADRVRAHEAMATYLERSAREDVSMLLRAAWHRARANDAPALDRVFARVVRSAQLSGEHAAIRSLGREVLGPTAETAEIDRLVGRLPWRVRHRRGSWLGAAALVISFAMLMAAFIVSRGPSAVEAPALLTIDLIDGDSTVYLALPDVTGDLANDAPIDLIPVARPAKGPAIDSVGVSVRLPNGDLVGDGIFAQSAAQGMDIFRITPDGRSFRLLHDLHDQVGAQLSPDGKRLAYSTGALHPQQRAELAVYDIAGDSSTRITTNDEKDFSHRWSIEGTRVGYLRSPTSSGVAKACWTSADGLTEQCSSLPDSLVPASVAGWVSDSELLIEADNVESEHKSLVRLDLETGRWRVIDQSGASYHASPSGRAIICTCEVKGYPDDVMAVFSPESPERKRVLRFRATPVQRPGGRYLVWAPSNVGLSAIVAATPDTVAPNSQTQLRITGVDAATRSRSVPVTSWRSLDTSVAIVDNGGRLLTRRPGRAVLVASAGGVLTDTIAVTVRERPVDMVIVEDWKGPLTIRWAAFGDPAPVVVGGALRVNGDDYLTSGVVSRSALPISSGAGVRARLRLPLSEPQWQSLAMRLDFLSPTDSAVIFSPRPSVSSTSDWQPQGGPRSCSFNAPRQEGGEFMRVSAFMTATRGVPISRQAPNVADSAWHTVTLQIFADGRCALAIDGEPVAISRNSLAVDRALHVSIDGRSVKTVAEVGKVEAWIGVRNDVDWGRLRMASPVASATGR
jgi:DNA-binding SARP family transcriptional activator